MKRSAPIAVATPFDSRARWLAVAGALLVLVLLAAMARAADAHGEPQSLRAPSDFGARVLARVNDAVITGLDFQRAFDALSADGQAAVRQNPRKFLTVLIQREVLYQEARRAGLEEDALVRERLDQMRRAVLIDELSRRQQARAAAEIGGDEARRYYEANRAQFTSEERISASHILLATREEAEAAAARLRDGADFAALAQEVSRDEKTRDRGGRLFVVFRGRLSPELEQAAFAATPGVVTGIVQDADGFHLVLVHDHVPAAVKPFEAVEAGVRAKVVSAHGEQRLHEFIAQLERRARIEVNGGALADLR